MSAYLYSHSDYPYSNRLQNASAASFDNDFKKEQNNLLNAISKVATSRSSHRGYVVNEKTLTVAMDIAIRIPWNREYPKVGVDDGCIFMIWGEDNHSFAITIEGERIHMNVNPGSNSTHLEPIIYDSHYLPPTMLQYIPNRR